MGSEWVAKYFLLSFDDGTVYDRRFLQLLNHYGVKGTFNLNSGLEDFVWHYEAEFPDPASDFPGNR